MSRRDAGPAIGRHFMVRYTSQSLSFVWADAPRLSQSLRSYHISASQAQLQLYNIHSMCSRGASVERMSRLITEELLHEWQFQVHLDSDLDAAQACRSSETVLYMHHRYMCQISKHQEQLQKVSSTRRQSLAAPAELLPMFQDLSCLAIPLCLLQIQIC